MKPGRGVWVRADGSGGTVDWRNAFRLWPWLWPWERPQSAAKWYAEIRQSAICLTYLSSRHTVSHV